MMDKYCPLISDEFLTQTEALIRGMGKLETRRNAAEGQAEQEQLQKEYEAVSQQLQDLINPPTSDDDGEKDEE